jgi:hypothetical protein
VRRRCFCDRLKKGQEIATRGLIIEGHRLGDVPPRFREPVARKIFRLYNPAFDLILPRLKEL